MSKNNDDAISISDGIMDDVKDRILVFLDQNNNKRAIIDKGNGVLEIVNLPSREMDLYLRAVYYENTEKTVAAEHIKKVSDTLEMFTIYPDVPVYPVYSRLAQVGDTIFYNLNNRSMVVINRNEVKIKKNSMKRVKFLTSHPQVRPNLSIKPGQLMGLFDGFIRTSFEWMLLLVVWICACCIKSINHPIPVLFGSFGGSKSTVLRILCKIIDPAQDDLMALPRAKRDFITTAINRYFLPFDNAQVIPQWMSDLICIIVTGGYAPMRDLFTTSKLKVENLHGCVCINGMDCVVTRKDLLNRAILIEMFRIPDDERLTELEFWKRFDAVLPDILGGVFNTLSKAISMYDSIDLQCLSRMADFEKWGYCIAEAMEEGYGEKFVDVYKKNQELTFKEYKPDILVPCLVSLMEHKTSWKGKTNNLHIALDKIVPSHARPEFPETVATMTRRIKAATNDIAAYGIAFKCSKDSDGLGYIRIYKTESDNLTKKNKKK